MLNEWLINLSLIYIALYRTSPEIFAQLGTRFSLFLILTRAKCSTLVALLYFMYYASHSHNDFVPIRKQHGLTPLQTTN
jgi:hypothetical protein